MTHRLSGTLMVEGELGVTSLHGSYLQSGFYGQYIAIEVHDSATNIPWEWKNWQLELPGRACLVMGLDERYARWCEHSKPLGEVPDEFEWPRFLRLW